MKLMHGETSFYKAPRYLFRKHNIMQITKKLGVKSFLDVGCGAGELGCSLAQRGIRGTGLDFSAKAIEVANGIKTEREIPDSMLAFKEGGLEHAQDDSYDAIICCEVLEHIEDDDGFLKELKNVDSRYLIVSVPARQKWFDIFDEKVGHYRRYEKADLTEQLEKHGYKVKDFRAYGYPFINLTRRVRKVMAGKVQHKEDIQDKTKESGINPIKFKASLSKIDLEPLLHPMFLLSRLFERLNLSEGYLVVCEKTDAEAA